MEPIKIRIEKDQSVNGQDVQQKMKEPGKTDPRMKAINGVLLQAGKNAVNVGISHYGDITGDHNVNRFIETITSVGADILTVVAAGPFGAIAVAGKYGISALDNALDRVNIRRDYERQLSRVGSFTNRGNR